MLIAGTGEHLQNRRRQDVADGAYRDPNFFKKSGAAFLQVFTGASLLDQTNAFATASPICAVFTNCVPAV